MTGEQMLQHVAGIIAERGAAYGDAATGRSLWNSVDARRRAVEIDVPRDRNGSFEPQMVPKGGGQPCDTRAAAATGVVQNRRASKAY